MALGLKVLQVVGYQNSGKTTLVTKLIHRLKDEGFKVGTIKHHGHGGTPTLGDNGKDTEQHRLAGASVVAVEGEGTFQLTAEGAWTLEKMLILYEMLSLDVVIVEGYKKEQYPKVVLLRDEKDQTLLTELTNVKAVISIKPQLVTEYPYFTRNEEAAYLTYLVQAVRGK